MHPCLYHAKPYWSREINISISDNSGMCGCSAERPYSLGSDLALLSPGGIQRAAPRQGRGRAARSLPGGAVSVVVRTAALPRLRAPCLAFALLVLGGSADAHTIRGCGSCAGRLCQRFEGSQPFPGEARPASCRPWGCGRLRYSSACSAVTGAVGDLTFTCACFVLWEALACPGRSRHSEPLSG